MDSAGGQIYEHLFLRCSFHWSLHTDEKITELPALRHVETESIISMTLDDHHGAVTGHYFQSINTVMDLNGVHVD